MELGLTREESTMLELVVYAEELQNVFDDISGMRLDPELLQVSRQVVVDCLSRFSE